MKQTPLSVGYRALSLILILSTVLSKKTILQQDVCPDKPFVPVPAGHAVQPRLVSPTQSLYVSSGHSKQNPVPVPVPLYPGWHTEIKSTDASHRESDCHGSYNDTRTLYVTEVYVSCVAALHFSSIFCTMFTHAKPLPLW